MRLVNACILSLALGAACGEKKESPNSGKSGDSSAEKEDTPAKAELSGKAEAPAAGDSLEHYMTAHRSLANDDAKGCRGAMEAETSAGGMMSMHAKVGSGSDDIATQRTGFRAMSNALLKHLETHGNTFGRPLHVAHCPMAFEGEGAHWVQETTEIDNPYYGQAMKGCGSVMASVEPGHKYSPAS